MIVKNDLFDYPKRYIFQDTDLFKFSLDSILLAEFVRSHNIGNNIIDMCAGNMAIPLIITTYLTKHIIGFEIQKDVYELAKKSIEYNKLNDELTIINDDIKNIDVYYKSEFFDTMICNPPFFKLTNKERVNNSEKLSIARHEIAISLDDVFKICKKHLKNKGCLYLIQRANRLDEIINLGYKYQLNVKEIQLVSTKKGAKPSIVIIKAVKNSNSGVMVNVPLCVEGLKTYQNIFKEGI